MAAIEILNYNRLWLERLSRQLVERYIATSQMEGEKINI